MDSGPASALPGSWSFPDDIPGARERRPYGSASSQPEEPSTQSRPTPTSSSSNWRSSSGQNTSTSGASQQQPNPGTRRQRHYGPRQCRICLETVLPTYQPQAENIPGMFQPPPKVVYESEEGRLISPCKCKGSQRYVHDGCLDRWRHSDPSIGTKRFWECPTCKYKYRLSRLGWRNFIGSAGMLLNSSHAFTKLISRQLPKSLSQLPSLCWSCSFLASSQILSSISVWIHGVTCFRYLIGSTTLMITEELLPLPTMPGPAGQNISPKVLPLLA
jgi:hypothetical protein